MDEFNDPFFTDVPARATYNPFQRVITVTYNSNPDPLVATPTNNDYNAIVAAIDGLANFSAVLSAGVGTTPFESPFATVNPVVFAANDVYFTLTDTADVLAQAIATKLNALDRHLTPARTAIS